MFPNLALNIWILEQYCFELYTQSPEEFLNSAPNLFQMDSLPCRDTSQNYNQILQQVVAQPNYPVYVSNNILNSFQSFES